jgi:NDP-sugar pyrophosphorylase family protein
MNFGIYDITLTLGHLAELVKAYFDHRRCLTERLSLSFVEEEQPTGTAGSLSLVPGLDRTFLAMNGDLLTDLDFNALVRFHRQQNAILTVATHKRSVKVDLGVIDFDERRRITNYIEKPTTNYHVSMGVYVYEPIVLRYIERGRHLDFPDLVLRLIEAGEDVYAYPADCQWLDIGRPDDYARAQRTFEETSQGFDFV